jgi:hypothetical protein
VHIYVFVDATPNLETVKDIILCLAEHMQMENQTHTMWGEILMENLCYYQYKK